MLINNSGPVNYQGPIITNYSPISSKGGRRKRKSKRFTTLKKKVNKSRTRRIYR